MAQVRNSIEGVAGVEGDAIDLMSGKAGTMHERFWIELGMNVNCGGAEES
jgi:hypothetical protein